jgi:hypothetical protein
LFARLAAYEAIPEAQARERISKLRFATQLPGRKISADDRSELDSLRARTTQRFIDKVFQADTTAAAQSFERGSYIIVEGPRGSHHQDVENLMS